MTKSDATSSTTEAAGRASGSSGDTETRTEDRRADDGERIDPRELQREIEERYDELEGRYDEIRSIVESYNDQARNVIREHPVASIAGALGTGYIVGRLAARRWLV
jgi:ElaB/YqjD/DUF883 family membrane-anchored ribosome-binding protein